MRTVVLAVAVVAWFAVAGCGSGDAPGATGTAASPTTVAPSPTPSPTATTATRHRSQPGVRPAACDRVWQVGRQLPVHYHGCRSALGEAVAPQSRPCSVGNRLVQFHRYYAVPGHPIRRAHPSRLEDPAYQQVLAVCTG